MAQRAADSHASLWPSASSWMAGRPSLLSQWCLHLCASITSSAVKFEPKLWMLSLMSWIDLLRQWRLCYGSSVSLRLLSLTQQLTSFSFCYLALFASWGPKLRVRTALHRQQTSDSIGLQPLLSFSLWHLRAGSVQSFWHPYRSSRCTWTIGIHWPCSSSTLPADSTAPGSNLRSYPCPGVRTGTSGPSSLSAGWRQETSQ